MSLLSKKLSLEGVIVSDDVLTSITVSRRTVQCYVVIVLFASVKRSDLLFLRPIPLNILLEMLETPSSIINGCVHKHEQQLDVSKVYCTHIQCFFVNKYT